MGSETVAVAGRVVTPDGVRDATVQISGGMIISVTPGLTDTPVRGEWIVPGFVDIHCHGGGGSSFTSLDAADVQTAVATHRAHGTTTMLASLVSAPVERLVKQIATLREFVTSGLIAGIHLEGPFLSSARCGAHDPAALRPPAPAVVEQLLAAGPDAVRMVTLAPELEHSIDAIRRFTGGGVIAAIGHTDALREHVVPAINAGATVATHLFNGMRPLHHREPGPVGALLEDERVSIELICDLVHLHPSVARLAATYAGAARTVLITDAISATAAGDGAYELGELQVTVTNGVPTLADGSLAGSTLTMDAAFRNLVTGCGLSVEAAVAASATKPAELLGLSEQIGAIRPGLAADLVVLDSELRPQRVMKSGSWIDAAAAR